MNMKKEKHVRLGKAEIKVLKSLYNIDGYTTKSFVAEKAKLSKSQTYQVLKNLEKKGLSGDQKTMYNFNEWYLTKKGFKKLVKNKHIIPKHHKKYDRWLE